MSRKSLKGRIVLATAAVLAIGVGGSAVALATSGTSGKTYVGCLTRSGTLTSIHVNPHHPVRCHRSKRIAWNQTGPAGPPGAQGPQGPPGATGASPTIAGTVMSETGVSIPSGTAGTISLACPAGDIATGGGGGFGNPGSPNPGPVLVVQDSEPTMTGATPTGWQLIASNTSGSTKLLNEFTLCLAAGATPGHITRTAREAATVRLTPIKR